MRVLVTGGAGYIGSHMVAALLRGGHDVAVVDDLSGGHRDAVPAQVRFVQADVGDRARVGELLRTHGSEAVVHFAGKIQVGESVTAPRTYYEGNLVASAGLLESVLDAGVKVFVFSSTAAVYGNPVRDVLDEEHPKAPINPYGATKLAVEGMLEAYGRAYGLRHAALRYFNAAGADVVARLAERHDPETHLLPLVLDAAAGKRPHLTVFGDDYPTPDGTCVRDYVHVMDLCEAHLVALEHLARGGEPGAFNLGTGVGHSVKEVLDVAAEVVGRPVPVQKGPRRAGDPPRLVADVSKAARVLGWRAKRASLREIVADAWASRQSPR